MPVRDVNWQKDYKLQARRDDGNMDYNSGGTEYCELLKCPWSSDLKSYPDSRWFMPNYLALCALKLNDRLTKTFALLLSIFSLMQTRHKDVSTCLKSDSYSCVVLTQSLTPLLILTETNVWYFKEKQWNIEGSCRVLCSSVVMLAKILARFLL